MHRSEFLKVLKEAFPSLIDDLNRQEGLLHFEVKVFRDFTQRAIFDGDLELFSLCISIAERAYVQGNSKLKNAIDVSFVEELEFGDNTDKYQWAWDALPSVLKDLYINFHGDGAIFL